VNSYSFIQPEDQARLTVVRDAYSGLRWAHATTDMRTARHSGDAYSSLALRCADPLTGELETHKLGVSNLSARTRPPRSATTSKSRC